MAYIPVDGWALNTDTRAATLGQLTILG